MNWKETAPCIAQKTDSDEETEAEMLSNLPKATQLIQNSSFVLKTYQKRNEDDKLR